jgi:hypothetical protein
MRLILAAITLLSLIFITPNPSPGPSPAPFESCSCAADDGSCNVSGTCPRGCLAYCPSGHCRVTCVGGASEEIDDYSVTVSLRLSGADSHRVAAELTRLSGAQVTFNPRQPDDTFDLDIQDQPLWNVLDTLSARGSIQIGHEDFGHLKNVRRAFLSGERMAVCFHNVTAKRLATDLSSLTGRDVYVASGDPKALVDFKGKALTFEEIVAAASDAAGVQLLIR